MTKKNKKQKTVEYKGYSCKLVDKWVAPEGSGAPILTMPNVPHPLHTCAPRTILGATTWNHMRNRCYYEANYICEACGARVKTEYNEDGTVHHQYHDDGTIAKRNLHAHELYSYDYNKGTARFERCVALCAQCVDEDTEVLTQDGWKKIPQITIDDAVACWDKSGSITFQHPTTTIEMEAEYINKITGRGSALFFSDGHRMPLKVASKQSSKYGEVVDVLAKDYKASHYYNWLTGGNTVGNEHLTDLERLYIAIEADGHLNWDKEHPAKSKDGKRSRGYNSRYGSEDYRYTYSISLYKSRKIERFKKLLKSSGLKYQIVKSNKKDYCDFNVWTNVECKHFANCFSQEMSSQKALEFIEELVFWDGTFSRGNAAWFTNKKEEVDFVQGVAAQCNVATSVQVVNRIGNIRKGEWNTPYDKLTYSVAFHSIRNEYSARDMKAERIKWGKKVYCITVPTSYFIARRDGFVFVTGNCHVGFIHSGRMLTMYKQGDPLTTTESVLNSIEHGFKQIKQWNDDHYGEEKLRVYYAVIDFVDDPAVGEKVRELIDKYEIEFYMPDGKLFPKGNPVWIGWKLIIGNKEYPSPFHSRKEWEDTMAENNAKQLEARRSWINRFKKFEGVDNVEITDKDIKKINDAKIPDDF